MTDKKVYTTHQLSRMCQVDIRTVARWIDENKITAYKTPGGHRRIRQKDLFQFLYKHGFPLPDEHKQDQLSILIVDDDEKITALIRKFLRNSHPEYTIDESASGIDALIKIGRSVPDVIIVDIGLPFINGLELIERIKSNQHSSETKVIVITGLWRENIEKDVFDRGAEAFFKKPVDMNKLENKIKELTGR